MKASTTLFAVILTVALITLIGSVLVQLGSTSTQRNVQSYVMHVQGQ